MKKYFYLFPLLLLSFTACEGDDDDGFDNDDEGFMRMSLVYTSCNANQIFSSLEKVNLKSLAVTDIPLGPRSYMAAEHPDTEIVGAESFQVETGEVFYEIMTDADVIFLFDADENLVCGYE